MIHLFSMFNFLEEETRGGGEGEKNPFPLSLFLVYAQ